jgi:hypothetical protein
MGRIYDKGAQRAIQAKDEVGPLVLWRYEVEYKKELADAMYRSLFHVKPNHRLYAPSVVYQWFTDRHAQPVFDPDEYHLAVEEVVRKVFTGDLQMKKLSWLRLSVRPVVRGLYQQGRLADVLDAIGITELEIGEFLESMVK